MPEILLIILGIVGAVAGWAMRRLLLALDELDFVSERNFHYRLNNFKAWSLWIATLIFYIQFNVWSGSFLFKSISEDPTAIHALESLMVSLVLMLISIFLNIIAVFGIFIFVRNLIAKTSPSIAWRAILLYFAISLCSVTIVWILISFVMSFIKKSDDRNELNRKINAALDPNREFFRAP